MVGGAHGQTYKYRRENPLINKERILKSARGKSQVICTGKPIRIIPDFSAETLNTRRASTEVMQTLREHKWQPRLLCPAKLSINIENQNYSISTMDSEWKTPTQGKYLHKRKRTRY